MTEAAILASASCATDRQPIWRCSLGIAHQSPSPTAPHQTGTIDDEESRPAAS